MMKLLLLKSIAKEINKEEVDPSSFLFRYMMKKDKTLYDELKSLVPDRFRFSILNDVFLSWKSSSGNNFPSLTTQVERFEVVFEHDEHYYDSVSCVSHVIMKGKNFKKQFCIDLPNSGFLYSRCDELDVFNSIAPPVPQKDSSNIKLDRKYLDAFPDLITFAKAYLSTTSLKCKLIYNFQDDFLIVKVVSVLNESECVIFNFHSLRIVDYQYDDDEYWLSA